MIDITLMVYYYQVKLTKFILTGKLYCLETSNTCKECAERGSLDDPYAFTISGLNTIEPEFIPEEYALHPAYPNPFNPVTTISYDLPNANMVSITIYDMLDREVRTLVAASQTAGRKSIRWDGKDDMGNKVAGGMYLCQIHAGNFIQTKKQMLLK